jgi:copper chaperone CopZ
MRQTLLILLSSLLLMLGGKELRVLVMTPTPQMHCENCENKIKKNLRFEKGITKIETSVKEQTVTVTYNAAKTTKENIQSAMKKIGYDTKVLSDQSKADYDKSKKQKKSTR